MLASSLPFYLDIHSISAPVTLWPETWITEVGNKIFLKKKETSCKKKKKIKDKNNNNNKKTKWDKEVLILGLRHWVFPPNRNMLFYIHRNYHPFFMGEKIWPQTETSPVSAICE